MKVLGIVCSGRRMGNSEIIAKHVTSSEQLSVLLELRGGIILQCRC